ncbi:iron-sulfur cluster biosynthesis family protein [Pontibacillus salicampi]|uniref:Iron-sulfur cluster biosynthesis family protein n=1 Tax=Pontibacillus salicampi TaxID=1449801 RepID=A0ABV6LL64_9BACI
MKLHITEEAKDQMRRLQPEGKTSLRLFYDIDGCGCGVNGMPIIYFTNEAQTKYDEQVENEDYLIFIDNQQKTFFEPEMTLAWNGKLFQLKSRKGLLNPSISSRVLKTGGMMNE